MKSPVKKFALWLKPDRWEEHIYDVSPESLKEWGVKAVILDLDNTFLPWKSDIIPEENLKWADLQRECGIKLFVLSNTTKPERMKAICKRIDAGWLHPAAKPNKKSFLKAAEILKTEPSQIAVIGDQLFTDMLGGKMSGMRTVLVRPLAKKEFIGTMAVSRPAERLLKAYMKGPF